MLERLVIAGSGGQGVLLIGKLLANAGVRNIPHVTFFPAYGAEVRGGVSSCQVVLSDNEVASPVSEKFESIILLDPGKLEDYLPQAMPDALVLLNGDADLARDGAVALNATELADAMGTTKVANLIMLGAYLALKPVIPATEIETALAAAMRGKDPSLHELNVRALAAGRQAVDG